MRTGRTCPNPTSVVAVYDRRTTILVEKRQQRARPNAGNLRHTAFTLLELMVSMSVLAILLILLMSMVNAATKLWRHSENRVESYREARAAVNTIASDLGSIFVSGNSNFFQFNNVPNVPKAGNSDTIFFLSAQPRSAQDAGATNANTSDLCAVGYFLGDGKTDINAPKTRNLYRYFRSSSSTFKDCIKTGKLVPDTLTTDPADIYTELLAKNVTQFHVRTVSYPTPAPAGLLVNSPLPDMIEIEVTVINNEAAKRITNWSDTNSITYKQNARTFTARVRLNTRANNTATPTPTVSPSPSPTP